MHLNIYPRSASSSAQTLFDTQNSLHVCDTYGTRSHPAVVLFSSCSDSQTHNNGLLSGQAKQRFEGLSAVTHRLPECKSSRCAFGISCLTFSKNTLSLSLLGLLHLSETPRLNSPLSTHSEITQAFVFSNVYPWLFYKFKRQAFVYTSNTDEWVHGKFQTGPKKSMLSDQWEGSVSHTVRWSWECPQLWGLLGSAEFCHQFFHMYCPVPWHQSPNRKAYTGLTPLFRFREKVRIKKDNFTAIQCQQDLLSLCLISWREQAEWLSSLILDCL